MKRIIEVNKDIESHKNANNYPELIERYGYVFFPILSNDRLRFFATNTGQIIIDFKNELCYLCENYNVVSFPVKIDEFIFSDICSYYNNDMKEPQNIRIQIIVDTVMDILKKQSNEK